VPEGYRRPVTGLVLNVVLIDVITPIEPGADYAAHFTDALR
jgi:hypothetical protein